MSSQVILSKMKKLSAEMLELETYIDGVYNKSFSDVEKYERERKLQKKANVEAVLFVIVACISFISRGNFNPPIYWILSVLNPLRWIIAAVAAVACYAYIYVGNQNLKNCKAKADLEIAEYHRREQAYARHAELEAELKKLKKSLPNHQQYRFFFEIPYKPFGTNYSRTGNWIQSGAPKFVTRDDKLFVEEFDDPVLIHYHEIANCISPETIGIYADFAYLDKHKDEKFIVERINYHNALPVQKTQNVYSGSRVNVKKELMDYESRLNGMERTYYQNAGYGFHTSDDLYYSGRMTDLAYLESCNIRAKRMSAMKQSLETHNANLVQTKQVVTSIHHRVFTVGYAIYNKNYDLVLLLLNRYSPLTNIITELENQINLTQYNFNSTRLLKGKVCSVTLDDVHVGKGSNFEALTYIAEKYRSKIMRFDPLEQPPTGMNDEEFRNWIKAKRHFANK